MTPESPAAARWLVRRAAGDATRAADLLADLDEEFRTHQLAARGPRGARLWYWRQAWAAVPHLASRRWERARAGGWAAEGLPADARYAVRTLGRSPLYAATAVLTLALGIGANTALFSVVRGVLLAPLPYGEPERIYRAWTHTDDGDIADFSFRVVEYRDLYERPGPFAAVGAEFPISGTLNAPDAEPVQVEGRMVTPGFFEVFGVTPAAGRTFGSDEIEGGEALVALVSHRLWRSALAGRPDAVGSTLDLDGRAFTVIGVLPPSYTHVSDPDVDVFIPYTIGTSRWIARWLDLYVRVRPGVEAEGALAAIDATIDRIGEREERSRGWHASVEPLAHMVVGDVSRTVWVLFASVGLLLIIACVNTASLSLARSVERIAGVRLRFALGAGRARLVRQIVVESLVVAALGGLAGLAIGALGLRALVAIAPPDVPRLDEVGLDPWVLAFTAGITLAAGLLSGLVPALRATGPDGAARLATGARGDVAARGAQPLLAGLVVAEVAMALALLVGAGLLVRTVGALHDTEMGFEAPGALAFQVSLPAARYRGAAEVTGFYRRYLDALAGIGGVTAVGAAADLPLGGRGAVASLNSEARVLSGELDRVSALQRRATPTLFRALGTPLLDGRTFLPEEDTSRPDVLVLSESLARALFPAGGAVGSRVTFRPSPGEEDWLTVVGVVADVQYLAPDAPLGFQLYEAHGQSPVRQMGVVVRGDGDPARFLAPARALLREMDPTLPLFGAATLSERVERSLARQAFAMRAFALFATISVLMAAAGVYGVLAFAVSRRRREIGVRMALGAPRSRVVTAVVGRGAALAAAGIGPGLLLAWALQRGMRGMLFGVEGVQLAVVGVTAACTLAVAVAAAWLPAARAARVDPSAALRAE